MRNKQGTVISDVNDKTIVVKVSRDVEHPIYKKNYRVSKKFHAHDEKNEAQIGDVVLISESKPLSKQKTWRLEKIISKNAKVIDQPAAVESDSEKELKASVAKEKEIPKDITSDKQDSEKGKMEENVEAKIAEEEVKD